MSDPLAPLTSDGDTPTAVASRFSRLRHVVTRNRALWITSLIAVVSLVGGLLLGRFVVSPAQAAAEAAPPEAGLVTVPVSYGPLTNDVTIRAEVGYDDPFEVQIDTSGLPGTAVVTGKVPTVGTELAALSVALEVAGRPVIVLPGELPAYRTLRFGVAGPDVTQFKQAMRSVGLDAGDPANAVFDEQAAGAVPSLYAAVGYAAPSIDPDANAAVRSAQAGVLSAEQTLGSARAELDKASAGADEVAKREADNAVASAERALHGAQATTPVDAAHIADLQDALALAQARRRQLDVAPDTSAARAGVDAATAALQAARDDLTVARQGALPVLPAGEVLPLADLPRRVDDVAAVRGQALKGTAMTVSGATVALSGSAAEADARLLRAGAEAEFDLPDGTTHPAVISTLTPGKNPAERWTVALEPAPLTAEQIAQLQGRSVRVRIAVGATEGDVLNVPLAALSAGPGGESRVQVVEGDPRDGERARTRLVTVDTGLAADGAAEVHPTDGTLSEGDLVVVGR